MFAWESSAVIFGLVTDYCMMPSAAQTKYLASPVPVRTVVLLMINL